MRKHSHDSDVEIRDVATNEQQIKNTFSHFTRNSASQHTASRGGQRAVQNLAFSCFTGNESQCPLTRDKRLMLTDKIKEFQETEN